MLTKLFLALIQVEAETNVIVVDWSRLAALIYWSVVKYTTPVGEYIGGFLNTLDILGYDLTKIHLIGHSLGAHIAGIAASWVDSKVGRITGLFSFKSKYSILLNLPHSTRSILRFAFYTVNACSIFFF